MNEPNIIQIPFDANIVSHRCLGKWYASRKGNGFDTLDVDSGEDFNIVTGEDVTLIERIETVNVARHEYLQPDGTWKNRAHYFNSREEIDAVLERGA